MISSIRLLSFFGICLFISSAAVQPALGQEPGDFLNAFVSAQSGGLDGPGGLDFGSDDHLYVSSVFSDQVLRYDGMTGTFIDAFVSTQGGGLDSPRGLVFGPDSNLYVSSGETDAVLRYDGTTGAFIDAFVSSRVADSFFRLAWSLAQMETCMSVVSARMRFCATTERTDVH